MATGNILDRMLVSVLDRPYVRAMLAPQSPPKFVKLEAQGDEFDVNEYFNSLDAGTKEKIALSISWIYSAVSLLANKVTSSPLNVIDPHDEVKLKEHDFMRLLRKPSEFYGLSYLLRYVVFSLSISDIGALWYLAPERGNPDNILEIWPVMMHRVQVEKSEPGFVKGFIYTPRKGGKSYRIDPKNCIWFRYADPHDWWASLSPLRAMLDAMAVKLGITDSQKKFYSEGRGIPLSVVSVNPDISPSDYAQFRADLKGDWDEDGTTLAVARGGTLDVKTLGLTQRDLEILGSQEFVRDELDAVILGIPLRGSNVGRGDGIKLADKFINDNTIHPLHILLSEEITLQGLDRYWRDGAVARFDDIRATDRALTIQENTIRSRWMTIDEMRAKEGLPPFDDSTLGEMLVPLANNAAFISNVMGFSINAGHLPGQPSVGNVTESQHPEALANQVAESDVSDDVKRVAVHAELKRFRTVAKRNFAKSGNAMSRIFGTNVIPEEEFAEICTELETVLNADEIDWVFAKHIEEYV